MKVKTKLQSEKIEKLENANTANESKSLKSSIFKCTKCNFESKSEQGLKSHMTRKHTVSKKEGYPKMCDLCEIEISNADMMSKHLKTHSYTDARFKCEDCEFVGLTRDTMEVHIGKTHTDSFECGLCELNLTSVGNRAGVRDSHLCLKWRTPDTRQNTGVYIESFPD